MLASLQVPGWKTSEPDWAGAHPAQQFPGQGPDSQDPSSHNTWGKAADEGPAEDASLPGSPRAALLLLTEAAPSHAAGRGEARGQGAQEGRGQSCTCAQSQQPNQAGSRGRSGPRDTEG